MSKRLKEVFANMRYVMSFLETIETDPCERKGTLEITIEEQLEDGSPWLHETLRNVKICHSRQECQHYEVHIDPATGIGKIKIEGIEATQHVIVEVDENGQQMIDNDDMSIQYAVDGEEEENDYATVHFSSVQGYDHHLRIVNRQLPKTQLELFKILRDVNGNSLDGDHTMSFDVWLQNASGYETCVTLCAENNFHTVIDDLTPGFYQIWEVEQQAFQVSYRLNLGNETTDTQFDLCGGHNELEIINERRGDTSLTIEKYVRTQTGELCYPSRFEEFMVRVISSYQDQVICLNEENNYCVTLYGLEPGFYDVSEVSEHNQYEVSYIVNDCNESCYANVELNECEHAKVLVINTDHDTINFDQQESPLRICKFIRRCDGCITKPDKRDSFKVMVTGCGMSETFLLNNNNNYCLDIADLCPGTYEVCEVGCGDYSTTYIVNDECERTSACIVVNECSMNHVAIINEERNRGHVNICKYIRNEYGDLVKPQKPMCFHVNISSFFCKKSFVLNAENDWCMSFDDLYMGSYEVREEYCSDYDVMYQVNGEKERRHARFFIDDCCDNEIKIINNVRKQTCGILKISKYEETDCQELVKPSQHERFEIEVSGPCFHELYCLQASNNWCILLEGLAAGEYQVKELRAEEYDVCYVVNREPMEEAILYLNEYNQDVMVINHRKQSGRMKLSTMVRSCSGEYRLPSYGEEFEILIEGVNHCCTTVLKASNGWCVLLDQLPEGTYRIIQKDTLGYKVSYQFHGKEETLAKLELGQCDEEVVIVNEEKECSGTLMVTKYMVEQDGQLYKPCPNDEFMFELRGRCFTRVYRLHARNDFCVYFDDLEEGSYEICEICEDYDVQYRINGECTTSANVTLGHDDVQVDILNAVKQEGFISIEKRIKRGERLVKPDVDMCYKILFKGKNCKEIYELNADNDFMICLRDLPHQHYEIRELNADCTMYEVNGILQENGYLLYDGSDMHVTIINEEHIRGCMEIQKMVMDEAGELHHPCKEDCFEILIESDCYKQKIELNADNDFCVQMYDLPCGHYEVCELNSVCAVRYQVNQMPCENAIVDLNEEDVRVMIINDMGAQGCLELSVVVDDGEQYNMPDDSQAYHLRITRDQDSWQMDLTCANQFHDCLCNLKPGMYTIQACDHTPLCFEIDGQMFEQIVCVELNGEQVVINVIQSNIPMPTITITKCMQDEQGCIVQPTNGECFEMLLLHNGRKQTFTLDEHNQWTKNICAESEGAYELREIEGGCDVQYQINQNCPSPSGYFEVCGEDIDVMVLNQLHKKGKLHVEAGIKDCSGEIIQPQDDQMFYMDVESRSMCKTYVFDEGNHWHQVLELEAGTYSIKQKKNKDFDECYYLVNDRKETAVHVYVGNEDVHVQSINVMRCSGGSIELSKVLRDSSCNCFHRPDNDMEYEVDICSTDTNYHQIISLNSCNKFHETLSGLQPGTYEIHELNPANSVCYMVNGMDETPCAIIEVNENMNTVKIINEEHPHHMGSIELCKLIRDEEGCYRYPDHNQSYWVQIKGEHGSSRVILNHANHFYASIRNLEDGWYEVLEESESPHVQYVVNNATPSDRGLVHVKQNANTVNVINGTMGKTGSIKLRKQIQNDAGLLVTPTHGSYRVHITSPGFNEIFVLDESNHYQMDLSDLNDGLYVVMEMDHDHVTYIVNGGSVVDYAIVEVKGNHNQVQIINQNMPSNRGSITLAKYIRTNQQLQRPQGNESFVFLVSRPGFNQLYTLDSSNDWMLTISELEDGDYVISETTTVDRVTYIINGGSEVDRAVVSVKGDSNSVQIINHRNERGGTIILDKLIRDGQMLVKPNDVDFNIYLYVSKPGYGETFELNVGNNWQLAIENLEDGTYVVSEVGIGNVTYIINGGNEVDRAVVEVRGNTNIVQIINPMQIRIGSILLDKYMRNQGDLVKPVDDFVISMRVSKPGYNETFELNARNNWRYMVNDLENGVYVVDEINAQDDVTYRINGGSEVNNAVVNVEDNMNNVMIIDALHDDYGSIRIEKYMRNTSGDLVRPPADFHTRVHVSKPGYNEVFTLNASNNFTITLKDLLDGYYVLNEVDSQDQVSYIINGGNEVENGIVHVMKNANTVQMIDTQTTHVGSIFLTKLIRNVNGQLMPPQDQESFRIYVEGNGMNQNIVLDRSNNWSKTVHDLVQGVYQVSEVPNDRYTTTYIVDNGDEQASAQVEVVSNTHTVKVINSKGSSQAMLEITKWIKQGNGSLIRPVDGDVFTVEIYNENTMRTVQLNNGNQFTIRINDLSAGTYNVREINNDQFITTYRVNGGTATDSATVSIYGTGTQVVEVINERLGNQNTIEVFKYMLDPSGNYLPPTAGETFQFAITGEGYHDIYDMDVSNDWHWTLTQYPTGTYQISEVGSPYPVQYLVNSAVLQNEAFISAEPSKTNVVGIINKQPGSENGNMTLTKRMRSSTGELIIPNAGEAFVIRVLGPSFERFVTLDSANGYTFPVESLGFGLYTLEEVGGNYAVSYIINGGMETSRGALMIESAMPNEVVIINSPKVIASATQVVRHSEPLKFVIE